MKFRDIIYEWLVIENKEQIYIKYYSDIDRNTFIRIIKGDPKTIIQNNEIIDIGKHARLILSIYKKGNLRFEDISKAYEYLEVVYKYNIPLDYNKIENISDLYEKVKDKLGMVKTDIANILTLLDENEYIVKMNNNDWYIFVPKTEKAAAYLGVNTEWCTTWGKYSLNPKYKDRTNNQFESHNNQGPLYIMINKKDENDKYQLHFESNQFKNRADREISNRGQFLNERDQIKHFLFPSLVNGDDIDQLKIDVSRSTKFLDKDDKQKLNMLFVEKVIGTDSDLINTIMNKDKDNIKNFFNDDDISHINFDSDNLRIDLGRNLPRGLQEYESSLRSYRQAKDQAYDSIYSDISYNFGDEIIHILDAYLEEYYNLNKDRFIETYGNTCKTYVGFRSQFQDYIAEDDTFKQDYIYEFCNNTSTNLENEYGVMIDEWESHLELDTRYSYAKEVIFPIDKLVLFIKEHEYITINDIDDFINQYINYYDLPTDDYFEIPEYDYSYPTQEFMNRLFDEFFDKFEDEMNDEFQDSENYGENCINAKKKFLEITKKYFDSNNSAKNEFVEIKIKPNWINEFDCEKGVLVDFHNFKTNEKYEGYMQIDNIMNYLTMEPLFERLIKNVMKEIKKGVK